MTKPETHDIFEGFPGGYGGKVVHPGLPWLRYLIEAVIQSGLTFEKVQDVGTVPLTLSAYIRKGRPREAEIRPDIPVGILIPDSLLTLTEPGMLLGSMPCNEIKQNMNSLFMSGLKKTIQIFVRSVSRGDFFEVAHVVAGIFERGVKAWIDP